MFINIISAGLMCIYGAYYYIPAMISNGSVLTNCCIILYYVIYSGENNRIEEIHDFLYIYNNDS